MDIEKLYQEYSSGSMEATKKDVYERAVKSGQVSLPQGITSLSVQTAPVTEVLPAPEVDIMGTGQETPTTENVEPTAEPPVTNEEGPGFIERIKNFDITGAVKEIPGAIAEQFTGEKRETKETKELPDWGNLPELHNLSWNSLKSFFSTILSSPEEAAKQIKKMHPGIDVTRDGKGNIIFDSPMAKKMGWKNTKFIIRPGFQESDIEKLLAGSIYELASKGKGLLQKAGIAGAIQIGVEGVQAVTGGDFDAEQIPLAVGTEFGSGLFSKAISRLKGAFTKAPSAAQTAVKGSEKVGIIPMTSDVIPPKTFAGKVGQTLTERVPIVGTGPVRVKQQADRVGAIKNIMNEFGVEETVPAVKNTVKDFLKKRSKDLNKYNNMKTEVIERLTDTNVDRMKKAVKEGLVFEDVAGVKPIQKGVVQEGLFTVPVENTNEAIKKGIEELTKRRTTESKKAVDILMEYGDAFQDTNLSNLEALRKELGNKLKSPDLATVRSTSEKELSKVYKALNQDMGNFIKKTGEPRDYVKWKVANKKISNMMGELKVRALKSVLEKGEATAEVVENMLFSQKPSEIKLLYKGLTPGGRKSAKIAILQRAVKKSGGIEELSTAKFLTSVKNLQNSTGVIFNAEDKKVLTGLTNALKITRRAETASLAPPTGVQNFQILGALGLGSYFGGLEGAAIATGLGMSSRIYESKPVRNILLQLSKPNPGKEQILIKQLTNAIQAVRNQKMPLKKGKK